ncbi:hypothetical protein F8S13_19150 [Chloroflexia bacterium SDU3-3]|nr:hypothetical protein F8S13_19150 [Chloroflexia bacterium SDU3-3]
MYTIHPLLVHAPIGLLVGNALLTALYLWRGDRSVEQAAYHCLWLGLLLLVPALASGGAAAALYLAGGGSPRPDALGWINAHALGAGATLLAYWRAWLARRRSPGLLDDRRARRGYLATLALGMALLVLTGWAGGHMVYVLGVGLR